MRKTSPVASASWRSRWVAIPAGALLSALLAGAALVAWPEPALHFPQDDRPLAITDVSIVDVAAGRLRRGQTVLVDAGRIAGVGPSTAVRIPAGARVIEGRGHYVMPALWDMHTHVHAGSPLLDLPLYVANGVTHVRDMQGCPRAGDPFIACRADKRTWSAEAEAGRRIGPRIVESSSFMANGPGMARRLGDVPDHFDTATPAQARAFVRHFASRADTIKVYDRIPYPAYRALADEARRRGIALVGHRPHAVRAVEAAGLQRSLEHARFVLHESFDGADALRALAGTADWKEDRRAMIDRHDPARADAIFAAMRAAGTYYVPTHVTRWSDAYADTAAVLRDPALDYVHPLVRMQWLEDVRAVVEEDPSPRARRTYIDFYRKGLALTGRAHRAGVKVMVGTDYIGAGSDVHRELEHLVAAGLGNADALRAATTVPAEYAGQTDRFAAIAPGYVADFVLLGGDPLQDIRNTRDIRGVAFNRQFHDRQALDRIRAHVHDNARSWSVGAKILWRFVKRPVAY